MNAPALELKALKKSYGDRVALGPVDLEVAAGQQLALVGANGSGKTTLLRVGAGLLDATEGETLVFGETVGSLDARAALCYLPDEPVLYDDLSVREHIEYLAPLFGSEGWQERGNELMERFGLEGRADDLPSTFSRGLRQKTSLVLGFVRPAKMLLVDEPFVGLDEPGRNALLQLLDESRAEGVTIVLASHQLDLVARSDRCVALSEGRVIYDGPPGDADLADLVTR